MAKDNEMLHQVGRIMAGSYYDLQAVRIASNNKIRDIIRKKIEGIPFNAVEEKKSDDAEKESKYTDSELVSMWNDLLKKKKITQEEHDYVANTWEMVKESEKLENKYKKELAKYIEKEPIYVEFLSKIRGIGEVLSANLLKEFGYCETYDTVSKLWANSGNAVDVEGKAPKKHKGEDLHFSPRLRTLSWKIGDCLLKANKGIYRRIYDTEKASQLAIEYAPGVLAEKYKSYKEKDTHLTKGHAHARALRKMRKLFLSHYWACARELKGLETRLTYVEEKLGHKNIISWQKALQLEMINVSDKMHWNDNSKTVETEMVEMSDEQKKTYEKISGKKVPKGLKLVVIKKSGIPIGQNMPIETKKTAKKSIKKVPAKKTAKKVSKRKK